MIQEDNSYYYYILDYREQAEAGLHLLSAEEKSRLKSHNDEYRAKFGFTFIITARENKAAAILQGLDQRFII